jgi:uncharacterized protein
MACWWSIGHPKPNASTRYWQNAPEDEGLVWQQFLDLVWQYPTAPVYHFCPFEVQTVERLAKLYGTPPQRIRPLLARFVDLHERVTRMVTLAG